MPDSAAVVRGSGASRRQIEVWRVAGHLHATIEHCRAEYDDIEIDVARALYRLTLLGVQPGGRLAADVTTAVRKGGYLSIHVGGINVNLDALIEQ